MLMMRPVKILTLVKRGTNLILTGPNLNILSNSAPPGFKSASVNGFEVAVARIAHRRT